MRSSTMTELSAKMSKHFHHNSVMPLSEANLSKHTLQSPPSREAKLKHILVYVDHQRELALEEQADLEEKNMSLDHRTPSPSSPNTDNDTLATRPSPLSPTFSSITKDKGKEPKTKMASVLHNNFQLSHSSQTPETTPYIAHNSEQQEQCHQYQQQKHLHNHEGQQQQQQQKNESCRPQHTQLHEKQMSRRPTSPDLNTSRPLSPSIMQQYTDIDPYPQQQAQPQHHNLVQNNTAFHHYSHGPHPNPLDPSLALPRALPRSMAHLDRSLYRDMFLSDDGTGQTLSPPSSPPPQFRPRHSVSPSPINIAFEPSIPLKHEIVPGAHRSESPVACSPSPTSPSEKKSRFSRFSFLGRSTSRAQNHKRHESVPATKADSWLNAKDRERSKFHSLTYRSGSRMAGSGSGMEITGAFDDSRYDQPQKQQPSQLSPKSSRVKRLFQDIFKSSSSSSSRSKKATVHTAREISLPSTYLGQQPESALEGSPQAKSYYNPRHSLVRGSTAAPLPSYPSRTSSPPQQQSSSRNTYTNHRYSRPATSLSTYMRESLVDPVQQLPHYRPLSSSLEQQPELQSSLYYYPDHQQQHYQNLELQQQLQQQQQQQQQQQKKEERRGLLHHFNDTMDDEDDDYMRAYAPYAQASLTPPPASSVLRHSTSSNRIFGLMNEDFDQRAGNNNNAGAGGCRSRPRTRPSSQLIAPVQHADLEGLLRQAPIVVV